MSTAAQASAGVEPRRLIEGAPWPEAWVDWERVEDTRDEARFVPLRVSCRPITPVITYGDGLPLDGIVSYGAYQRWRTIADAKPAREWWLPTPDQAAFPIDFELPLAKWALALKKDTPADPRLLTPEGEVWGWCASNVVVQWLGRERMPTRGKSPAHQALRYTKARRLNVASGRYKAIDLAHEARHAEELVWYALGDPEPLADLLARVPNVGKRTHTGNGKIEADLKGRPQWRVEMIEDDWSLYGPEDQPMRALPWGHADGPARRAAVRAPSYHRTRQILCHAPLDP